MVEVVSYIVKQLALNPESVRVEVREDGDATILEVGVLSSDMGRVIGKSGRVAQSIRAIVKSVAAKDRKKYVVKFNEINE